MVVGALLMFFFATLYFGAHGSSPSRPVAPIGELPETAARVRESPMALIIHQDGLSIENRTESPLDNCFIEILGGFVAQVPVIPAHGEVDRSFLVLFDSEDHENQAHLAGKTFQEFVLGNITAKASVACQDINGRRVTAVFHQ